MHIWRLRLGCRKEVPHVHRVHHLWHLVLHGRQ